MKQVTQDMGLTFMVYIQNKNKVNINIFLLKVEK